MDTRPLLACCLANFLLLMYTTVATVSASRIGADVGGGDDAQLWFIDVYTLVLAALVLAMGTVGDHLGHVRLLIGGLVVFVAATAACAAAQSAGVLVGARAVQGAGGAAMFATTIPLLVRHYAGRQRAMAFAIWGAVAGAGSSIGVVGGGAATDYVGWRWLFLAGVPVGVVALVLAGRSMRRESRRPVRIDLPGTLCISIAMAALTYGAINAGPHGWTSVGTLLAVAAGVVAVVLLVSIERRTGHPVLPPGLFGTRVFVAVLVVAFAYYFGAFAALPAVSSWLQESVGMSAVHASLVLAVQLAAFVPVSLLLSARLHGLPRTWVLGGGTVLTGLAGLAGVLLVVEPSWPVVLVALVVTGVGAGVVSPVLPAVAATAVPDDLAGTAGAAANSARQLGLTLGVAVCGAVAHGDASSSGTAHGIAAALGLSGLVGVVGGSVAVVLFRSARANIEPVRSAPPGVRS